jgi:hypothetical protein
LNEILSNLGSGDQYGMTIGERIQLAADISGTSAEQEGTSNLEGKNVNFEGHYEAAKKKAQADNDVDAAKRNSDK